MARCLRICGAYSYRLSRRHSTVLLIGFFIVTLTVIFQMYAYRHQDFPHNQSIVGDFDYRPGVFLRGRKPNENRSYCDFHYGLPDALKWEEVQVNLTPDLGERSHYRVIYNAVTGTLFTNTTKYDAVTYITQATPEFLYHIVEIARLWDGPISVAVFVPDYDLEIVIQTMEHLCRCYEGMGKVSLHLFYPKRNPPKIRTKDQIVYATTEIPTTTSNVSIEQILQKKLENYRNMNNKTRAEFIQRARANKAKKMMMRMHTKRKDAPILRFLDCMGTRDFSIPTYRAEHNLIYPINVGRNVARNASKTNYFLVSDIEMVPSVGLAPQFLTMVRRLMGDRKREEGCIFAKTVFVVPLFEVERGEEIPRDKDTLVRLVAANRATYFHQKICSHCQRFPGLQTWLTRPAPKSVEPMLIGRREYPYHRWEPLYFGTQKEPWYSELLSWEGKQDKMTQMLELCLQEYRMVVLDGAFLCHAAAPRRDSPKRYKAERVNALRYYRLIQGFKARYRDKPRCKIS